mmetsp:Transcript_11975/g.27745  ORF Transcript_11975/g.27745 Transcript_11975/m.27745 type:complete len:219 (-) Transcript_11975:218-874(-)
MGIATHKPSGMLWIAMATPRLAPDEMSSTVARKVARPSGKLCTPMASAVITPIRVSFFCSKALIFPSPSSPVPPLTSATWYATSVVAVVAAGAVSLLLARSFRAPISMSPALPSGSDSQAECLQTSPSTQSWSPSPFAVRASAWLCACAAQACAAQPGWAMPRSFASQCTNNSRQMHMNMPAKKQTVVMATAVPGLSSGSNSASISSSDLAKISMKET